MRLYLFVLSSLLFFAGQASAVNSLLFKAIREQKIQDITEEVRLYGGINDPNEDGFSPLAFALATHAPVSDIEALLRLGADPAMRDGRGRMPIVMAIELLNTPALSAMLKKDKNLLNIRVNQNRDTLLTFAAHRGNLEAVQVLIEAGADTVGVLEVVKKEMGDKEEKQVAALIENRKKEEDKNKTSGAVKEEEKEKEAPGTGNKREIEEEKEKEVEKKGTLDEQLVKAVESDERQSVSELLVRGANPNANPNNPNLHRKGNPVLITAVLQNNLPIVQLLLNYGANINAAITSSQVPAIEGGNIVWELLWRSNAQPTNMNIYKTLEWLVHRGVNLALLGPAGNSIVSGVSRGNPALLRWFLERGAVFTQLERRHERTKQQIDGAYSEELLGGIVEGLSRAKLEAMLSEQDSELLQTAFILAIAQRSEIYNDMLEQLPSSISTDTLQEGLVRAALVGNDMAARTLINYQQRTTAVPEDEWQGTLINALRTAIVHGRRTIISELLTALPPATIKSLMSIMERVIGRSVNLDEYRRTRVLEQLHRALETASSIAQDHLSSQVSAALSSIITALPSGTILALAVSLEESPEKEKEKKKVTLNEILNEIGKLKAKSKDKEALDNLVNEAKKLLEQGADPMFLDPLEYILYRLLSPEYRELIDLTRLILELGGKQQMGKGNVPYDPDAYLLLLEFGMISYLGKRELSKLSDQLSDPVMKALVRSASLTSNPLEERVKTVLSAITGERFENRLIAPDVFRMAIGQERITPGIVRYLLTNYPSSVPFVDGLMHAISTGQIDMVRDIVQQFHRRFTDADFTRAIERAVVRGDFEIVQFLLDQSGLHNVDLNFALQLARDRLNSAREGSSRQQEYDRIYSAIHDRYLSSGASFASLRRPSLTMQNAFWGSLFYGGK